MNDTNGPGRNETIVMRIRATEIGFAPKRVWCPAPSVEHRTASYPVPKTVRIGTKDTAEAGARFSPSPYAVLVESGRRRAFVGIQANAGWHRWNFVSFDVTAKGVAVHVDLEGHTSIRAATPHIRTHVVKGKAGEDRHALLRRGLARLYPAAYKARVREMPAWWKRPIYCGWGDQVGISLKLEGPGLESRCVAYCIQGLYERWTRRLDKAGVPIGTVIIDGGWSAGGVWKPHPSHWPDMKGFIARQHEKGRRVLLWTPLWYHDGLPDAWCAFAGKDRLTADPTNPAYRCLLTAQVRNLLSADGFDADGFKIDMLGCLPSERAACSFEHFGRNRAITDPHPRIRIHGRTWGCEALYLLQKTVYDAAKAAKPDALITSSSVHPYFHDTLDMVRLHDTGDVKGDAMTAMKARADLARAALPHHLIDADDWIAFDFEKWLSYTCNSHTIGVPCLFYAEEFVRSFDDEPVTTPVTLSVLKKIARAWRKAACCERMASYEHQ